MEDPDLRASVERTVHELDAAWKPLTDALDASERLGNDLDLIINV